MKICDLYYLMFVCVSVSLYAQGVALGYTLNFHFLCEFLHICFL